MLLKEITALRGPSGWEDEARNAIRKEAEAIVAEANRKAQELVRRAENKLECDSIVSEQLNQG